ncbi:MULTISPECIES: hypothetical protein [Vibrio]|uniref:hypothetical protein n=1 Tax=Vibrio TaxID=662 RepID=UPI00237D2019|nr:hypothetical protein [Vibrio aestuarianus]MDE1233237.1 hypothetical protein [Vibrio aestuarianus]
MKYRFITYGFFFVAAAFGVMGLLTLMSLFVSNRDGFSTLLSDLGSFGSFLSGVGTIIAAAAAAYGVDTWSKQLKSGKYLVYIWECKALLSQFNNEFYIWHAFHKSPNESLKTQGSNAYKAIEKVLEKLNSHSLHLDALSSKSGEKWVADIRGLRMIVNEHRAFLNSTDFSTDELHLHAVHAQQVIARFASKDNYVKALQTELDNLEKKWS